MSDCSDNDCRLPDASNDYAGRGPRRAFLRRVGFPAGDLVCVRQVHGTGVVRVTRDQCGCGGLDAATALGEYDAIITNEPGLPIGVSVADCVPLILFDPVQRAAAVGHAGRLGTLGNIAHVIVESMLRDFGVNPSNIHAEIGPSAGPERYEVSETIANEFEGLGLPRNGCMLDLWGANLVQLQKAGVPAAQISVTGHCTISDERYFSHRRDGSQCRNLAVAVL